MVESGTSNSQTLAGDDGGEVGRYLPNQIPDYLSYLVIKSIIVGQWAEWRAWKLTPGHVEAWWTTVVALQVPGGRGETTQ